MSQLLGVTFRCTFLLIARTVGPALGGGAIVPLRRSLEQGLSRFLALVLERVSRARDVR
jgi:hypothetical protein